MKIFVKMLTILLLSLCLLGRVNGTWQSFPEDITSLDYLVYSSGEYFLGAYFYTDPHTAPPSTYKYDYRNGITVYPFNDVKYNMCYVHVT